MLKKSSLSSRCSNHSQMGLAIVQVPKNCDINCFSSAFFGRSLDIRLYLLKISLTSFTVEMLFLQVPNLSVVVFSILWQH